MCKPAALAHMTAFVGAICDSKFENRGLPWLENVLIAER